MKQVVTCYPLKSTHMGALEVTLELPTGSDVLDIQEQGGTLVLWVLVYLKVEMMQEKRFLVVPTGAAVNDLYKWRYRTTVQLRENHGQVFHIFEAK